MKTQLTTTKRHLYRLNFYGRRKGAIGIFYAIQIDVPADDPDEAKLLAYDTHEHIAGGGLDGIRVELIARTCPNCQQWQHLNGQDCLNECVRRGFAVVVNDTPFHPDLDAVDPYGRL